METKNQLTFHEAQTLVCYILMTTNYRKDEINAWEELAKEKDEDGKLTFPKAKKNADFYRKQSKELEAIKDKLDNFVYDVAEMELDK